MIRPDRSDHRGNALWRVPITDPDGNYFVVGAADGEVHLGIFDPTTNKATEFKPGVKAMIFTPDEINHLTTALQTAAELAERNPQ